jgi:hypothetical protein
MDRAAPALQIDLHGCSKFYSRRHMLVVCLRALGACSAVPAPWCDRDVNEDAYLSPYVLRVMGRSHRVVRYARRSLCRHAASYSLLLLTVRAIERLRKHTLLFPLCAASSTKSWRGWAGRTNQIWLGPPSIRVPWSHGLSGELTRTGWAITFLLLLSRRIVPAESIEVKEEANESAGPQDLSCLVLY